MVFCGCSSAPNPGVRILDVVQKPPKSALLEPWMQLHNLITWKRRNIDGVDGRWHTCHAQAGSPLTKLLDGHAQTGDDFHRIIELLN